MPISEEKRLEVLARLKQMRKMEEQRKKDLEQERKNFLEKFKNMTQQEKLDLVDEIVKKNVFDGFL